LPNKHLSKWLAHVFHRRVDLILCKDLTTPPGQPSSGCLEVVPIRSEHRNALMQHVRQYHMDTAKSIKMLDDCLRQGYEGRLALLNGQIIGYRWWVTHKMSHPQLAMHRLTLHDDEVFAFGLYIARPFRARGYAGEFLAGTQKQLMDMGYKRLYNAIDIDNTPARRLNEAYGSTEFARHVVIKLFSSLTFCAGRLWCCNKLWM